MQKELFLNLGVTGVALAYTLLLYDRPLGLNVLLFSGIVLACLWALYPESRRSGRVLAMAGLTLFTGVLVVMVHSQLTVIVHILTLLATAGLIQRRVLRFLGFMLLLILHNLWQVPIALSRKIRASRSLRPYLQRSMRYLPMVVLPGVLVGIFLSVYLVASETFLDAFLTTTEMLGRFFTDLSLLEWWAQLMVGAGIGALLLSPIPGAYLPAWMLGAREQLVRNRRSSFRGHLLALKHEHRVAVGLLAVLNGLTFLYQVGAFRDLFLSRDEYHAAWHLSHQVHFATYALIFSVLLAMTILLYYFRGNQNFYPGNHLLRSLAVVWLGQNLLLLLVVALYNFRYIEAYGLAYKRIGVLFFLAAVLGGLVFSAIKILRTRTLYYLWQRSSWLAYGILLLAACINWEVVITRYNLHHTPRRALDAKFLINDISDQNLLVLEEEWERIEQAEPGLEPLLQKKQRAFEARWKEQGWLSWNWPDHRNARRLP